MATSEKTPIWLELKKLYMLSNRTHQGLVPVPLIIAKRLNSIRGTRRFTKPSQTNGYLIF